MRLTPDPLSLIGNTPILELTAFGTGSCRLFLKLENQNPGGSIKDRVALSMIAAAEKSGTLNPGGSIIEATAGNTGLGLALVSALKGYKLSLVIPDKMSREKVSHIQALGARVIWTRSDVHKGHPEHYQDLAQQIATETGAFYTNQFANPANPDAHEATTGPEIFSQMNQDVDAIVCGVGSGGTLTGLGRYFKQVSPKTEMILADPIGSILSHYVNTGELRTDAGSWLIEGIGEDFIPSIADMSLTKRAFSISDEESLNTARELLRHTGILAGSSTGTLLAAALRYCREQKIAKRVITFACDSGNKYLSKMFNDYWMIDNGFVKREVKGDLRDLISRRYSEGAIVTISPEDTIATTFNRMRLHEVSQLPVVEGERIAGIVDEWDLLVATKNDRSAFSKPIRGAMTTKLQTLSPDQPIDALLPIFERGHVAIIQEGPNFLGLITKIDYLNYLRRRV